MCNGWIKLHRKIAEHPDYLSERFDSTHAWIDLILLADYKTGEFSLSISTLAKRWKWERYKVQRYLKRLEDRKMISRATESATGSATVRATDSATVYAIDNYSKYQSFTEPSATPFATDDATTRATESATESATHLKEDLKEDLNKETFTKVNAKKAASGLSLEQKKEELEKRAKMFYCEIEEYLDRYPKEMLIEFYDYWSEPNKSYSLMKFERETTWDLSRRIARWSSNNFKKYNFSNATATPRMADRQQANAEYIAATTQALAANRGRETPPKPLFGNE